MPMGMFNRFIMLAGVSRREDRLLRVEEEVIMMELDTDTDMVKELLRLRERQKLRHSQLKRRWRLMSRLIRRSSIGSSISSNIIRIIVEWLYCTMCSSQCG